MTKKLNTVSSGSRKNNLNQDVSRNMEEFSAEDFRYTKYMKTRRDKTMFSFKK